MSSLHFPLNKTSSSYLYAIGSGVHPSIFLITTCVLTYSSLYNSLQSCVCMSTYIRVSFSCSSMLFSLCVCFLFLCSSVKPAVCVYSTWFTCSRRAGCQQQPRRFTSTLSEPHHCRGDSTSTSRCADTGCTARSLLVEVGVWVCVHVEPFVPPLSRSI